MSAPTATPARFEVSVVGEGIAISGYIDGTDLARVADFAQAMVRLNAAVHIDPTSSPLSAVGTPVTAVLMCGYCSIDNHSNHSSTMAGACVGCPCPVVTE